MTDYLKKRKNGTYYYRRRVPSHIRDIDGRDVIFLSLKTSDETTAIKKAAQLNTQLEGFWDDLSVNGGKGKEEKYRRAVKIAKMHGFSYMPAAQIAETGPEEIMARLSKLVDQDPSRTKGKVQALLGGIEEPGLYLNECFERFIDFTQEMRVGKSEAQIRRWKTPRETAFKSFIKIVGNKQYLDVDRSDMLKFRGYHVARHVNGDIKAHTVNQQIMRVKVTFKTIEKHLQLGLPIKKLFDDLLIDEKEAPRPAFQPDFVQNKLLDRSNLQGLNDEAWAVIAMMANTGMRPSEICGLDAEDIHLDADIPYVKIAPKDDLQLKTSTSEREIPLTGVTLCAFQQYPQGLVKYKRKSDSLSACVSKYLERNELRPTPRHTLYSLRHTFQDLLRQHGIDERLQCELMGHKYRRPAYGAPTLAEKLRAIESFAFKAS